MSLNWEEERKKKTGRDYRALIGEKFGRLTVESVEYLKEGSTDQRFIRCYCECACGKKMVTSAFNLLVKDPHGVRSCGCLRKGCGGKPKPLIISEEELRNLYIRENLTVLQISKLFSLSVKAVEKHLKKYGIKKDIGLIVESINRTKKENLLKNPKPPKEVLPDEWVVYMHTSPEGKSYIGQTKRPKNRWGKGDWGYKNCVKFQEAIDKFGWENFTHKILERGIKTSEEAFEREKFWINYYDTFHNGYNSNEGGRVGPLEQKAILQIEPDTLRIVARFESLSEAVKTTGISAPCISQCCSRIIQTAGKFCWCYEQDYSEKWTMPLSSVRRGRRIFCIETKEIFHSPQEAAKKIGVTPGRISRVCGENRRFRGHPVHGFHFCYLGEEGAFTVPENKNLRRVRCLETGQEYTSIKEAAEETNINYTSLKECVNGKKRTAGGFHWEGIDAPKTERRKQ